MPKARQPRRRRPYSSTIARRDARVAGRRQNCFDWDLDAAEQGYRRAIELDPSYATAFHWLGMWVRRPRGGRRRLFECFEQAIELDPLSPPIIATPVWSVVRGAIRRRRDVLPARAFELDPHFHRPFWFLGLSLAGAATMPARKMRSTRGSNSARAPRSVRGCSARWATSTDVGGNETASRRQARTRSYAPARRMPRVRARTDRDGRWQPGRRAGVLEERRRDPGQLRGLPQDVALVQAAAQRASISPSSPGSGWPNR